MASTRSAGEVFVAFLKLGLTSFGGPIAHLGYYRREFVERRRFTLLAAWRAGAIVVVLWCVAASVLASTLM